MLHVLAFLLFLPAQGINEAEQLFRKMEAKLLKARTLECAFEVKMAGGDGSGEFKGSVALAEGNKLRVELAGKFGEKGGTLTIVSDGVKIVIIDSDVPTPKTDDVPKALNERASAVTARAGAFMSVGLVMDPQAKDATVDELLKVAEFKLGKKEKLDGRDAQIIEYKLTPKDENPGTVSIWLDAKTNLPLKRLIAIESDKLTVTETYTKLTLDEKIDPKTFELPK